ncbi:PCI domain-containing protein [Mycena indigotica]|uniref:PCI domain-containing protein n=1 Tax=Mycena indigotica TaxID=2126181 RepID=A0A8H6VZ73_9AGAR|nr:PCI domain-containing protein [Mycena indigotica]KAF7293499.1 PCI domain-containing protein [Mycena indigotica]
MSLDRILQQITTTTNLNILDQTLETSLPKESRDTLLSSPLASGQDPLKILDLTQNNCISSRLSVTKIAVHLQVITTFLPEQARLAPRTSDCVSEGNLSIWALQWQRVFLFARIMGCPATVQPLFNLVPHIICHHNPSCFPASCVVASQPSAACPRHSHCKRLNSPVRPHL